MSTSGFRLWLGAALLSLGAFAVCMGFVLWPGLVLVVAAARDHVLLAVAIVTLFLLVREVSR